jgi:murein DD-endopeptidase MepM/ murein hydrolase activator NlpD
MKLAALVLTACLSLVSAARAASWERPVRGPVLRPFALSADRYARGQHRGVDLGAPLGAAVRAACGGRVRFAGSVPGGGRTVSVGCGALVATYQHLGVAAVRRGEPVAPGAVIGTVGRSGHPRDPRSHLHLGAREAASGRYVDPLALLGPSPRAIPPVALAPRRHEPLGRAPEPPQRWRAASPEPLVPAPAPFSPVLHRGGAPVARVPLAVWIGLAAFGLGLPLGGLVTRRRRRRGSPDAAARTSRWTAAAHR